MSRLTVIDFPLPVKGDPSLVQAMDVLRATVGKVTSLLVVPLQHSATGEAVVGAVAGTAILQAKATLDLQDAFIDQIRLEGYGGSSGSGDSVRLKQGATVLATASLANPAARFVGAWTVVDGLAAGDLSYDLEVVGNAARTQTLYRVALHARTLRVRV